MPTLSRSFFASKHIVRTVTVRPRLARGTSSLI